MEETPKVGIVIESLKVKELLEPIKTIFRHFKIWYEERIISASFTPDELSEYATSTWGKGIKVIITVSREIGLLSGTIASRTLLPIISVPIDSSKFDSLHHLPSGLPIAIINGPENAALLAVEILALENPQLQKRLKNYREEKAADIRKMDEEEQKGEVGQEK